MSYIFNDDKLYFYNKNNYISTNSISINKGLKAEIKSKNDIGIVSFALYKMSVNLKKLVNIESCKYTPKLYMYVHEIYEDCNGVNFTVNKIVNIGSKFNSKSTVFNVEIVSKLEGTQLKRIKIEIINNLDTDISINNIGFYKGKNDTSAGDVSGATYIEIRNTMPDESEILAGRVFYII